MVRPGHYQALIAGAAIALGLWFLTSRLWHWNNDVGTAFFHGQLPPIPEYGSGDEVMELHNIDDSLPEMVEPGTDSEDYAIEETSTTPATPSTTPEMADWDPLWDDKGRWPEWSKPKPSPTPTNSTDSVLSLPTNHISHADVQKYVRSILDFEDDSTFERVSCPSKIGSRYNQLPATAGSSGQVRYFFALDLHQSARIIPRLMSSILEAMRYLGPQHCALSVVDGRSDDGTYEILAALKPRIEAMGAHFFLETSDINPSAGKHNRVEGLAKLRNLALKPLKVKGKSGPMNELAGLYSPDTIIIFVDDVALCPEDILELLFQHERQRADMTCAFDWIFNGTQFHDVWVSRSLVGDTFFEIPHDASWAYSHDMFWSDPVGQRRYQAFQPLQVYSCWGGMVTLNAASFAEDTVKFRSSTPGECHMGEPTLLAKDLYRHGHGKILVVPAVNVAYSDEEAVGTKEVRGYVSDHVDVTRSTLEQEETVSWQLKPPGMVKCLPNFDQPSWIDPT